MQKEMNNLSLSMIQEMEGSKADIQSKFNTLNYINNFLDFKKSGIFDSKYQIDQSKDQQNTPKLFTPKKRISKLIDDKMNEIKEEKQQLSESIDHAKLEEEFERDQQKNRTSTYNISNTVQQDNQTIRKRSQSLDDQDSNSQFNKQNMMKQQNYINLNVTFAEIKAHDTSFSQNVKNLMKFSAFSILCDSLSRLNQMRTICLSFQNNNIISEGLIQLSYSFDYLPQLKVLILNFSQNYIQSDGFQKLSDSIELLQQLKELKLDFSNNQIDDSGLLTFSDSLKHFSYSLQNFDLNLESNIIKSIQSVDYFCSQFLKYQKILDFKFNVQQNLNLKRKKDNPLCDEGRHKKYFSNVFTVKPTQLRRQTEINFRQTEVDYLKPEDLIPATYESIKALNERFPNRLQIEKRILK